MPSLGIVANVYNEVNAIAGWLEMACGGLFDDVAVYHAGPGGKYSDDGTIEIIKKWGARLTFGSIDEGFGIVRTAAVRFSTCDWVMLLDADERFHQFAPVITCSEQPPGDRVPANWEHQSELGVNLATSVTGEPYNQGAWLKDILYHHTTLGAVSTIRRHWNDFSWRRPTQSWHAYPDHQLRVVRNVPNIHWDANTRMHEHLVDDFGPINQYRPNQQHGPFFDHYHMYFKAKEPEQRQHDIRIYDALHFGRPVPQE